MYGPNGLIHYEKMVDDLPPYQEEWINEVKKDEDKIIDAHTGI